MLSLLRRAKDILARIIGFDAYRVILVRVFRLIKHCNQKEVVNPCITDLRNISDDKSDEWFGYYDVNATNQNGGKQLSLAIDNNSRGASIVVTDMHFIEKTVVAHTHAWNYQMGARLQW